MKELHDRVQMLEQQRREIWKDALPNGRSLVRISLSFDKGRLVHSSPQNDEFQNLEMRIKQLDMKLDQLLQGPFHNNAGSSTIYYRPNIRCYHDSNEVNFHPSNMDSHNRESTRNYSNRPPPTFHYPESRSESDGSPPHPCELHAGYDKI